ncbi:protein of unknown function [Taphrina deformans PYCC 5710]|uniref:C2H2-type domain-containing protein n=1 Tax=Taphrina deformans (strain PYCC 5710 / ATCC 11124 / CBS 356.35 / IMI 108563 / JCM 9778 / NBRC 8474) TaxID=1097556 RepID=R4XFF2_TAPDE|nr:protein of unknown function [Taphrina deformans PYCC 5710]|eukprot:CCG83191.1 protein of unknown function [Taphrina deformans PYCC 5710]
MELPLEDVEAIDAEIHEIIPSSDSTIDGTPYTGPFDLNLNVSSAKNQDRARVHIPQTNSSKDEIKKSETAGSVLSEFTLDLRNTTRPADIYYDPDELSAIAAINDSREQRLRSLDPDLPGHLPGEVLSQDDSSIDADCGFPVYKCGFWQCSAELHDYDTLVKHCDKVHGHTDNSVTLHGGRHISMKNISKASGMSAA